MINLFLSENHLFLLGTQDSDNVHSSRCIFCFDAPCFTTFGFFLCDTNRLYNQIWRLIANLDISVYFWFDATFLRAIWELFEEKNCYRTK